jgi:hypothetical protein
MKASVQSIEKMEKMQKNAGLSRTTRCRTAREQWSMLLLALVLGFAAVPAAAQGCAMCYQTVKGAPKDGQRALNRAILVMLVPPLSAMTLGVGAAFRYGKKRDHAMNDEVRRG